MSTTQIQFNTLISKERTKLIAVLISRLNDFELAEDVFQEASLKAWKHWQHHGIPKHPTSWILKAAYNQAIDIIRRRTNFNRKQPQITQLIQLQQEMNSSSGDEFITDERLKLIFTCCHPALDDNSQVALTLNTICGFKTEQVAAMFLLKTPTMAQRLVRAKRKIKRSGIPYKTPEKDELNNRIKNVLKVIYLIFNQGYYAAENKTLLATDQTEEAIHLALTLNQLMPDQAELLGLLSLMYFHLARTAARSSKRYEIISLEQQNRSLWSQQQIKQAKQWFQQAMKLKSLGSYQIQAAISGVHCDAKKFEQTDWQQICLLYEKLYSYLPNETVRINQAVALAFAGQAPKAWQILQSIEANQLDNYLPFYLAKAHVLKNLNKNKEAINHFSLAMSISKNHHEKAFLRKQIELISD